MTTIKEVAKLAGVGVGTVSRVINNHPNVSEEKRKLVQTAIQKLRFTPNEAARRMKMHKTLEVALMVPDISHPYLAGVAFHIEDELYRRGYKLLICNNLGDTEHERAYLTMLQRHQIAGIVGFTNLDAEAYVGIGIPFVSIDRYIGASIPVVASDNFEGGRRACRELLAKGCKNIAFLGNVSSRESEIEGRMKGFQYEAELQKVNYKIHKIVDVDRVHEHASFIEGFLDEADSIDGVFCISDLLAAVLYIKAKQRGIAIPEKLKIIGFDGIQDTPYFHPILSTIKQPVADICREAVALLLKKIDDPRFESETIYFPITYIEGETT